MTKNTSDPSREIGLQMSLAPKRLFNRREAAEYMGRSLRKFDQVKHLYRVVDDDGLVRYDRVLIDRHIDLLSNAA